MNLDVPSDFQILPQYGQIFSSIIQLQEKLQQGVPQDKTLSVNDLFTVIEKAYWKLYLQQNEQNLSENQIREIQFYLTSKIGKSLDSQLSKTTISNNKAPKWFLYKGYTNKHEKTNRQGFSTQERNKRVNSYQNSEFPQMEDLKFEKSIKQEDYSTVDPYHASVKLEAQRGLPQIEVIYKFFSINQMLEKSKNMMDIEKITILHRKGNAFDRDDSEDVEGIKEKFRKKFLLYKQLIRIFEYYGYGARIAKKQSKIKQKITGNLYQYAVVHISKICFKLLQKYVMNFINNKTRYTHRSRLEKITYNMFNLPTFFTPQQKINFIKLIKIIFEVEPDLPAITKVQLQSLYKYLLRMMDEKQKNPDKFKNEYMIKLQNPTFYNVRKEIREQVKQQAEERKRLGIRIKGRNSKILRSLNELKKSIGEEKELISQNRSLVKGESQVSSKKQYNIKKQQKRAKRQYGKESQEDYFSDSEDQFDDYGDESQDVMSIIDSDDESEEDIKKYFKKSTSSKKSKGSHKSKDKKKKIKKDKDKKSKKSKKDKSDKYGYNN